MPHEVLGTAQTVKKVNVQNSVALVYNYIDLLFISKIKHVYNIYYVV